MASYCHILTQSVKHILTLGTVVRHWKQMCVLLSAGSIFKQNVLPLSTSSKITPHHKKFNICLYLFFMTEKKYLLIGFFSSIMCTNNPVNLDFFPMYRLFFSVEKSSCDCIDLVFIKAHCFKKKKSHILKSD